MKRIGPAIPEQLPHALRQTVIPPMRRRRALALQGFRNVSKRMAPDMGFGVMTAVVFFLAVSGAAVCETWRGLQIAPEHRCSPYDRKRDYRYPQSIEQKIVNRIGAVYGPYTGTCFNSTSETDIEHIIAVSEAHDSGLCAQDAAVRKRFATDIRNLTLARPEVNRNRKSDKDAGEWLPDRNRCWFAGRVVAVRRAYGLTIDRREAAALERILANCENTEYEKCGASRSSFSCGSP